MDSNNRTLSSVSFPSKQSINLLKLLNHQKVICNTVTILIKLLVLFYSILKITKWVMQRRIVVLLSFQHTANIDQMNQLCLIKTGQKKIKEDKWKADCTEVFDTGANYNGKSHARQATCCLVTSKLTIISSVSILNHLWRDLAWAASLPNTLSVSRLSLVTTSQSKEITSGEAELSLDNDELAAVSDVLWDPELEKWHEASMSIGSDSKLLPAKMGSLRLGGCRKANSNIGLGNAHFITTTHTGKYTTSLQSSCYKNVITEL